MPLIISKDTKLHIIKHYEYVKHIKPDIGEDMAVNGAAMVFGVSDRTIRTILIQGRDHLETCRPKRPIRDRDTDLNHYVFKKDLQRLIWQYNSDNKFFTLDNLLTDAKENLEFEGGRTTLFRIMKSMGYKYKHVNGRKILTEQKHVQTQQIKFLRTFIQHQNCGENVTFVYLDETWIYQNGSSVRRWVHDSDIKSNPSKVKNEGKRFTILHAGCNSGFLENCDLLLDSKNNDRDYHKTMTGDVFQNWVLNQLIPALTKIQGKCVVVMDNAPYHSVQLDKPPTFSCSKSKMQEWLVKHNIDFEDRLTKKQLWDLIKPFRSDKKRYATDELLKEHGYEVLRLPPYHCEYNPIEMVWGQTKQYYNKHINSRPYSKDKVANLWREALSICTPEVWQNCCRRTDQLISTDWTKLMGNTSVVNIPPFIISLEESDSDSDIGSDYSDELMEVE